MTDARCPMPDARLSGVGSRSSSFWAIRFKLFNVMQNLFFGPVAADLPLDGHPDFAQAIMGREPGKLVNLSVEVKDDART